jgi:16S rRNA C967 or C1407 C5-methylase (RsmB/RsmF family)/NOL1/NOP2/fmu family ribosome biogenesis protein
LTHKIPQQLLNSLQGISGFHEESFMHAHTSGEQVTSIRINPAKVNEPPASLPVSAAIPWCSNGFYLAERPSFTLDPVFHGGAYYVQDASSMFVEYIVKHLFTTTQPQHVLDLCGAPGGKSTLLASALPKSFIVSNEVIKSRVTILAENLSKWGSENVVVTNNDPKDFARLQGFFDLVVVDAPCSGSGLFRKDPSAIEEWSEANVQLCSQRQQRILADTIGVLRQNGYLIYSTCSYSKLENEDICDWIVDHFQLTPVKFDIDSAWGIEETASEKHHGTGYRFYPGKVKGEGFFIACFKQENVVDEFYHDTTPLPIVAKKEQGIINEWMKDPGAYQFVQGKEFAIACPAIWRDEFAIVQKILGVRKSGVAIGSIKGKDLVPHHEFALSNMVSDKIHKLDVSETDALKYLRRQDFTTTDTYKGWSLVRYNNVNLGWIKMLPNRINNYYPTNWRILKP